MHNLQGVCLNSASLLNLAWQTYCQSYFFMLCLCFNDLHKLSFCHVIMSSVNYFPLMGMAKARQDCGDTHTQPKLPPWPLVQVLVQFAIEIQSACQRVYYVSHLTCLSWPNSALRNMRCSEKNYNLTDTKASVGLCDLRLEMT